MSNHELFDWRQKKLRVFRVAELGEDYTVQQINDFRNGKSTLRFVAPNFVSLSINNHRKALKNAKEIYQKLIKPRQKEKGRIVFTEEETITLYDYFEDIQTAIISITTAVEALTNALIPDDFTFKDTKEKEFNKHQIQRNKSTVFKLKEILPEALKIKSPAKLKSWTKFTQLVEVRNELIHLKTAVLSPKSDEKYIVSVLLDEKIFNKVDACSQFINELAELVPYHCEFPILRNTETLKPIEIDKWEDHFRTIENE